MTKLSAKEWLQLGLMFPFVLWAIGFSATILGGDSLSQGSSSLDTCYLPLYYYSGSSGYTAALCSLPQYGLALVRLHTDPSVQITINHTADVVLLSLIFIASVVAWLLFFRRIAVWYVPST